jgi:hypothetical protein
MVKIKRSLSKKQYLKGKHVYDYLRLHMPIPTRFSERLEPYFKEDFQVDMTDEKTKVTLTYTHTKKPTNK